jgi:hypothetical protein
MAELECHFILKQLSSHQMLLHRKLGLFFQVINDSVAYNHLPKKDLMSERLFHSCLRWNVKTVN